MIEQEFRQISVKVSETTYQLLRELAKEKETSYSAVVNGFILSCIRTMEHTGLVMYDNALERYRVIKSKEEKDRVFRKLLLWEVISDLADDSALFSSMNELRRVLRSKTAERFQEELTYNG